MGIYKSKQKKYQNTVTVYYINKDGSFDMPSSSTLKQLNNELTKYNKTKKYIYFHWSLLTQQDENKTLEQIINDQIQKNPHNKDRNKIFIVIQDESTQQKLLNQKQNQIKSKNDKLYNKLKNIQPAHSQQQYLQNFSLGKNGNMLFQGRQSALIASSISYALKKSNVSQQKINQIAKKIVDKHHQQKGMSMIGKFFQTIGLAKKDQKNNDYQQMLQKIKQNINQFSDFDPKFIYYIEEIYIKFMIKSLGKINYVNYNNIEDFQIASIPSNSKIGIIGDFGTGLKDSIELLKNMVENHNVNVILHLGDVYYAGTPQQYQISITKPLNQLRFSEKVNKRQIRFYSIPGNHDYYSWGLPFLCFVKNINSEELHKQKASYFRLKDQHDKWQFLGMDTAFYDSNPLNQIDPLGIGPHLKRQQLIWHKHRLQSFPGSTILLSHHQLFSIHQRINGQITKYRKFSCINPMLSAQLFQYIPQISGWFWGHQHSFMLFKQKLAGLQKGRLIGNSSFHVLYQRQHPYSRKAGFPKIPLIVSDQQYLKYIPKNPNVQKQIFYALTYAVIDLQKIDFQNNIPIQYWCSPCYSNQQIQKLNNISQEQRNKIYFKQYMIHNQVIYSRDYMRKNTRIIKSTDKIYLRCQIGLCLAIQELKKGQGKQVKQKTQLKQNQENILRKQGQQIEQIKEKDQKINQKQNDHRIVQQKLQKKLNEIVLNLQGTQFQIQIVNSSDSSSLQFCLKTLCIYTKKILYLTVSQKKKPELKQIKDQNQLMGVNGIWQLQKIKSLKQIQTYKITKELFQNDIFRIKNKKLKSFLGWDVQMCQAVPKMQDTHQNKDCQSCLWALALQSLIKQE